MKILFVSSGNSGDVSVVVKKQAESLIKQGVDIDFYLIKGKGAIGYLKNIKTIRNTFLKGNYDVIHAHYSLSAFAATLAGARPLIVTLMGSDVLERKIYKYIIKIFRFIFKWRNIIVQSNEMEEILNIKKIHVIPNGVDLSMFFPMDKTYSQLQLGWDNKKKHVLLPANPQRYVKNYLLAQESIQILNNRDIELHCFDNISHTQTPMWYNAADVILSTSLWEGSPNVIKEAMACNRPIVATDVGDIKWLFGEESGHFLTDFNPKNVTDSLQKALSFSEKQTTTNGRKRIIELGLDLETIANEIVDIYKKVIEK